MRCGGYAIEVVLFYKVGTFRAKYARAESTRRCVHLRNLNDPQCGRKKISVGATSSEMDATPISHRERPGPMDTTIEQFVTDTSTFFRRDSLADVIL